MTTCLWRLDQRVEGVEELLLGPALAVEELDVVDQQQVERAVVALEVVEGLVLVGAHHVGDVALGVDVADLGRRVAGRGCRCRSPGSGASCPGRRRRRRTAGCRRSGAPATCIAAARASWLALPETKLAKVNVRIEARLLVPACRARRPWPAGRARGAPGTATGAKAARTAGAVGRGRLPPAGGAPAGATPQGDVDRPSLGELGELGDPGGEALLHPLQDEAVGSEQACSPLPASSSASGRIQVPNCCGVSSSLNASRQRCQNAGGVVTKTLRGANRSRKRARRREAFVANGSGRERELRAKGAAAGSFRSAAQAAGRVAHCSGWRKSYPQADGPGRTPADRGGAAAEGFTGGAGFGGNPRRRATTLTER